MSAALNAPSKPRPASSHRAVRGFIEGLGAAGLFLAGAFSGPKPAQTSVANDWEAIGNDLRVATQAYGRKPHA